MSTGNSSDFATVALIAGPTASGKSDLAVDLAQELERRGQDACVINADSAQVYADLEVLSARPSEEEMRGVPHRLFGAWDGAEACSAADWADAAKREIENAQMAGIVPILVGGTGLYIRTLLDGIAPVPPIHEHIREQVRALETQDGYRELRQLDPDYAISLKPADRQRILRGLEVIRSTGRSLKDWQKEKVGGIAGSVELFPMILLPEREWLYDRCDRRFSQMVAHGAREEVERLLARNLPPELPAMRAIGVPQIAGWIRGEWSEAEAVIKGKQATRNYAKRQFTWFRRQPPEDWPRMETQNVQLDTQFETLFRHLGLT